MELLNEYDQQIPRPPAFCEQLEPLTRPEDATMVSPSSEAKQRKHMRAVPHRGERPRPVAMNEDKGEQKEEENEESLEAVEPRPALVSERERRRLLRIKRQLA